jgi:hypothetical protein
LRPVGSIKFAKSIYNSSSDFDIKRNLFVGQPIKLQDCCTIRYVLTTYYDGGIKKAALKGSSLADYYNAPSLSVNQQL